MFCYLFYWLFKCRVLHVVCVRVFARARVWEGETERERETHTQTHKHTHTHTHRVTSQRSVQPVRNRLNHGLCANTYELHHCVCNTTLFPSRLELMIKLRMLLTVFIFTLKAEAGDYGKGCYISDAVCGVRPITMLWVSWPIRADCACRKVELCRKRCIWEAGHKGPTIIQYKIMFFFILKYVNIFCYTKYTP